MENKLVAYDSSGIKYTWPLNDKLKIYEPAELIYYDFGGHIYKCPCEQCNALRIWDGYKWKIWNKDKVYELGRFIRETDFINSSLKFRFVKVENKTHDEFMSDFENFYDIESP